MSPAILITGGAGFIGTHLSSALVREGYSVRVLDLKPPGNPILGVDYIQGDVKDSQVLERAVQNTDAVFHFAAMVSVPLCQTEPLKSYQENLMNTTAVLEVIRKISIKEKRQIRILFSGSSAVYGSIGLEGSPICENQVCLPPTTYYMAQKLASEHAVELYHSTFGIPAVVFRFFNVYGQGQDASSPYSGVISQFASRLSRSEHLTLFGDGNQTRDFVAVQDIVQGCLLALRLSAKDCDGQPVNLGSGVPCTIRNLAFKMMEISGARVSVEIGPERKGEVIHSLASIERAHTLLGWSPSINLEQGLTNLFASLQHLPKKKAKQG